MDTRTEKPTKLWIEIAGWYGMAAVLGAYALVSFEVLDNTGIVFQLLNLTGAAGLLVLAWYKKATQVALLNLIWALVALAALIRLALS